VRFDGLHFRLVEDADSAQSIRPVLGLTPDNNGDLWVRPLRPSLLSYRRGRYDSRAARVYAPGTVATTARAADGSLLVWMLKGEPYAAVLRGDRLETVSQPQEFSRSPVLALTQLPNGEIWAGTRDAGLFRLRGNQSTPIVDGLPDPKVNCLLATSGGEIWVGTDDGLTRWNGRALTAAGIPNELRRGRILALAADRHSNLWVGTNSKGLIRLDARGQATVEDAEPSPDAVTALFEDREGSIWVGRANRVERLRIPPFVALESTRGLAVGAVVADSSGAVWAAPLARGLIRVENEAAKRVPAGGLDGEPLLALAGSGDHIWAGAQNGSVTSLRLSGGTVTQTATYDRARGLPGNAVAAIHPGKKGTVWVGTIGGGAVRLDEAGAARFTTVNGLASDVITSIAETSDGRMWFGTPRGLSSFSGGVSSNYSSTKELPSPIVNCLFADRENVLWIGTAAGLARVRSGQVESLGNLLREGVLGIAEDRSGWLWFVTSTRVLRIDRRRLLAGSARPEDFREYGQRDGVPGTEGNRRQSPIVADASGRIWLASRDGVLLLDPEEMAASAIPVSVDIQTIVADGEALPAGPLTRVPPERRRIIIGYAGLSLSSPERIRFRYRLDGFDRDWSEPVAGREAVYTNLGPGDYTFRVMASNPDGAWSGEEASIQLGVQPAIWQMVSFRLCVGLAAIATVGILYRRRLQQLAFQLNLRFEERLAERTRIAQELHDTLLQGFLSASMQLHVAADSIPDQSQAKPQINRVLDLMGQVIEEGRNAVRGLRSFRSQSLDIEEAFSTIQDEIGDRKIEYQVVSTGDQLPLHPILRDEVYRIGREAILNAFQHSGARKIEVNIDYARGRLRVAVRDDGTGIDEAVLTGGREGHWGLSGMRERAERIGAQIHVWSSSSAGTEMQLDVPGHIAFRESERPGNGGWLAKLTSSRIPMGRPR